MQTLKLSRDLQLVEVVYSLIPFLASSPYTLVPHC